MSTIQTITDALLIQAIACANHRVVLIAPGVWPPLASAIADAWQRLGPEQVTVILDVDPEICPIGYGSLEGLNILQMAAKKAGEALAEESGVRICVLLIDEQTFVYSPTPRLLEEPPGDPNVEGSRQPKVNGIILSKPPTALESELGAADGFLNRTVGMENLNDAKLEQVKKDLEKNPAKKFDLSRAVNVYNAKIQFVELKVAGCRLSEHKARLPKHLIHVLKKNPDLSKTIENSISLLDNTDSLVNDPILSQDTVFKLRASIEKKYLRPVQGSGTVIERTRKDDFIKEVAILKSKVASFAKKVEEMLSERLRKTAEQLAEALLDDVLNDIPPKWDRKLGPRPGREQVYWLIFNDLLHAFGDPAKRVCKMSVETVFKDVTYDMLKDSDFRAEIAEYFPDLTLMEEYSAAKERDSSS